MPAKWLETREIPVRQLARFPGNARRGNVSELRKSIRANGQYRAIVVRQYAEGLVILAGNHTYDALVAEKQPTARCEVIECSDHEARRINLADNRLSDLASDDTEALVELLSYLDGDYEGTGWSEEDVTALITPPEPPPAGEPGGGDDEVRHYAVVLLCVSGTDQQATCEFLTGHGYSPVPARLGETVLRDAV